MLTRSGSQLLRQLAPRTESAAADELHAQREFGIQGQVIFQAGQIHTKTAITALASFHSFVSQT